MYEANVTLVYVTPLKFQKTMVLSLAMNPTQDSLTSKRVTSKRVTLIPILMAIQPTPRNKALLRAY